MIFSSLNFKFMISKPNLNLLYANFLSSVDRAVLSSCNNLQIKSSFLVRDTTHYIRSFRWEFKCFSIKGWVANTTVFTAHTWENRFLNFFLTFFCRLISQFFVISDVCIFSSVFTDKEYLSLIFWCICDYSQLKSKKRKNFTIEKFNKIKTIHVNLTWSTI